MIEAHIYVRIIRHEANGAVRDVEDLQPLSSDGFCVSLSEGSLLSVSGGTEVLSLPSGRLPESLSEALGDELSLSVSVSSDGKSLSDGSGKISLVLVTVSVKRLSALSGIPIMVTRQERLFCMSLTDGVYSSEFAPGITAPSLNH